MDGVPVDGIFTGSFISGISQLSSTVLHTSPWPGAIGHSPTHISAEKCNNTCTEEGIESIISVCSGQVLSSLLFSLQVVSDSFVTPWTVPCHALLLWDFSGKTTRVGCHFLLQGIFPTQESNPGLLHWHVDSLPVSHLGSPIVLSQMSLIQT